MDIQDQKNTGQTPLVDEKASHPQNHQQVPMHEKIIFGAGDLLGGGAMALVTAVYTVFLTMNGIPIAWAGIIVMISKIWDAISDPLMGVISDNTRTKWGRRRPYLFVGGILFILSFAWLFLPLYGMDSRAAKFAIYLTGYLFYSTIATVIQVPYSSFSTELSTSYQETTSINTIRLYFSMASSALSSVIPILLIDKLQSGKIALPTFSLIMVFVFGVFYSVPMILAGIFCKERMPMPAEKSHFSWKSFVRPLNVKAFRYLLAIYLCAFTCMDILASNIVYFTRYGLKLTVPSFLLLAVLMVGYVLSVPFLSKLMKKGWDKPKLVRMGIPLYMAGVICFSLLPQGSPNWVAIVLCALIGVGMSGCQMMPWIIFPDVVDIGELKLGDRPTGTFSGVMTFARKTSAALAIAISSFVLSLTGFIEPVADADGKIPVIEQPVSAQWGLRLIMLVSITALISVVFWASKQLKLTPARSEFVKDVLLQKAEGTPLSAEQEAEVEKIAADLF